MNIHIFMDFFSLCPASCHVALFQSWPSVDSVEYPVLLCQGAIEQCPVRRRPAARQILKFAAVLFVELCLQISDISRQNLESQYDVNFRLCVPLKVHVVCCCIAPAIESHHCTNSKGRQLRSLYRSQHDIETLLILHNI